MPPYPEKTPAAALAPMGCNRCHLGTAVSLGVPSLGSGRYSTVLIQQFMSPQIQKH